MGAIEVIEVMTMKEVAAYLRVAVPTITRLLKRGGIPGFKIGSDWRFNRAQIDAWIANHQQGRIGEND
jgi:excisionase family DNA binding protein